jgi:hypothetical protein
MLLVAETSSFALFQTTHPENLFIRTPWILCSCESHNIQRMKKCNIFNRWSAKQRRRARFVTLVPSDNSATTKRDFIAFGGSKMKYFFVMATKAAVLILVTIIAFLSQNLTGAAGYSLSSPQAQEA